MDWYNDFTAWLNRPASNGIVLLVFVYLIFQFLLVSEIKKTIESLRGELKHD